MISLLKSGRQSQLLLSKAIQRTFDDGTDCLISVAVIAEIEKYRYKPTFPWLNCTLHYPEDFKSGDPFVG